MYELFYGYVAVSTIFMYYLYNQKHEELDKKEEELDRRQAEIEDLEDEICVLKRRVKFYKYCFNTQKRAERSYIDEIHMLRNMIKGEQNPEIETKKRDPSPTRMTLRPRDETGKVKRRKVSEENPEDTETNCE